ncbi:MAG: hypothetical protein ABSA46_17080 [Thermodesulfovibrionales bacterium]|jgi:hypothetical protein
MIRRLFFGAVVILLLSIVVFTQTAFALSWAKTYSIEDFTYGTEDLTKIYSIRQTSDGGYIASGDAQFPQRIDSDAWLIKLDGDGNVQWEKTVRGLHSDSAIAIQQTFDGGYVAVGSDRTLLFDPIQSAGTMWISKLDSSGNFQWQKTYDSANINIGTSSVQQTVDGGYIVGCSASAFFTTPTASAMNACILKFDGEGNITWQKAYGGVDSYEIADIQQTSDGGYVAMGNISAFPFPTYNRPWIVRFDSDGQLLWQKIYDDANRKTANSIQPTLEGGYIVGGSTSPDNANSSNAWLLKLNTLGDVEWQKSYSSGDNDLVNSVRQTSDAGYIAEGNSFYFTPLISGPFPWQTGHYSSWTAKFDPFGNVQWMKKYGDDNDFSLSAQETSDNGYIVAGNNGSGYIWLYKLDSDGDIASCPMMEQSNMTVGAASVTVTTETASEVPISLSMQPSAETVTEANATITEMCVNNPLPVPNSQEFVTYIPSTLPSGGTDTSVVKPFGVYASNGVLSLQVYMQEFLSPVDIYLAIFAPSYESDILVIKPDNSVQPVSAGLVKWRENTEGPIYEFLCRDISLSNLRSGTYYLYTGVASAGQTSDYSISLTSFTIP